MSVKWEIEDDTLFFPARRTRRMMDFLVIKRTELEPHE